MGFRNMQEKFKKCFSKKSIVASINLGKNKEDSILVFHLLLMTWRFFFQTTVIFSLGQRQYVRGVFPKGYLASQRGLWVRVRIWPEQIKTALTLHNNSLFKKCRLNHLIIASQEENFGCSNSFHLIG